MKKKWTYYAVYSIIQMHFVQAIWEEMSNAEANIYASPGSDVNLTCHIQEKGFLVQTQWSKITDKEEMVGIYHPEHGFYCGGKSPCESLVSFQETPGNISEWTLHLRNMSSSLSGKYECTFTLYPEGIRTRIYNVLIQNTVTKDEQRSNRTLETEVNQTLKMLCFPNMSSEIPSEFTVAWFVEDNGIEETLLTRDHPISNSTLFKDRVRLGADYALYLSPVQIHDDHRKFSCEVTIRPRKSLRSSTTVKVFAKPEIPMILENNSTDVSGKRVFICLLKKVFPTATLTWLINGNSPQGEKEIDIADEMRKDKDGFLEVKSVLTQLPRNTTVQSNNMTIWCMALSPVPENKQWNVSSEKITVSFGSVNPPTDPPVDVRESSFSTQTSPAKSTSHMRSPDTSSTVFVSRSRLSLTTTHQTSSSTSESFKDSWMSTGKDTEHSVSWLSSETYSSSSSDAGSTPHGDVIASTTGTFSEILTTANRATKRNYFQITGIVKKPRDGMSWPVIVAALLFSCMVVFGLGVRKWCQYQKEILERPPPFKPPPPPIKYTCIQETIGGDLPCHEMQPL